MKEKIIYTQWLANDLIRQGFPFLEVRANPERPEFNCWVFENTLALRNAIERLLAIRRRNNKYK